MKRLNQEQLDELLDNIESRIKKGETGLVLENLDLSRLRIENRNLKNVGINKINLRGSIIKNTRFENSDMLKVDLSFSYICNSKFYNMCIRNTMLEYSTMEYVECLSSSFGNVGFTSICIKESIFKNIKFMTCDFKSSNLIDNTMENIKTDSTTSFYSLQCPEEGSFVGFKKCLSSYMGNEEEVIVKLLILEDALRSSAASRRCRCSKAKVLAIEILDRNINVDEAFSTYDKKFLYKVGGIIEVEDFDENRWNECTTGIHFFITREEAASY